MENSEEMCTAADTG